MTDTTHAAAPAAELSLEEAGALAPLVTAAEAAARIDDGAVLVDTRSAEGRAADGTVPGALVIDRYDLDALFDPASPTDVVPSLDTPVVVICGSVRGSGPVAKILRDKGFDAVHVEDGFPAWKDTGLPVDGPV